MLLLSFIGILDLILPLNQTSRVYNRIHYDLSFVLILLYHDHSIHTQVLITLILLITHFKFAFYLAIHNDYNDNIILMGIIMMIRFSKIVSTLYQYKTQLVLFYNFNFNLKQIINCILVMFPKPNLDKYSRLKSYFKIIRYIFD